MHAKLEGYTCMHSAHTVALPYHSRGHWRTAIPIATEGWDAQASGAAGTRRCEHGVKVEPIGGGGPIPMCQGVACAIGNAAREAMGGSVVAMAMGGSAVGGRESAPSAICRVCSSAVSTGMPWRTRSANWSTPVTLTKCSHSLMCAP